MSDRTPYVGTGADGCRRSAQIDREEADGLDRDDERWASLMASAENWEHQAALLDEAGHPSPRVVGTIQPDDDHTFVGFPSNGHRRRNNVVLYAMSDGTVRWQ